MGEPVNVGDIVTVKSPAAFLPGKRTSRPRLARLAPIWVPAVLLALNAIGLPYYILPIAERLRHPLHQWLKPSGYVGQAAGVMTCLLFLFMYLYPLRKRIRRLAFLGSMEGWLDVHIFAGLVIPIIGAMHASWRFQGLIGLGYLAMLMVSLSGIVGRYLYVHIPHGRSGAELSLDEIEKRRKDLTARIAATAGVQTSDVEPLIVSALPNGRRGGVLAALKVLIAGDLARWRTVRALRRRWAGRRLDYEAICEAVRLTRKRMALDQQLRMLDASHRLFRLWHVVHKPFSITAFVAVFVHVIAMIVLGVTWFW
jgi:hypothetical protein